MNSTENTMKRNIETADEFYALRSMVIAEGKKLNRKTDLKAIGKIVNRVCQEQRVSVVSYFTWARNLKK